MRRTAARRLEEHAMSADASNKPKPEDQRDRLAESEKDASPPGSRSWDDRNETDKVVHINPPDPDSDRSIQGIDPKQ
jgi:hypothetical protein